MSNLYRSHSPSRKTRDHQNDSMITSKSNFIRLWLQYNHSGCFHFERSWINSKNVVTQNSNYKIKIESFQTWRYQELTIYTAVKAKEKCRFLIALPVSRSLNCPNFIKPLEWSNVRHGLHRQLDVKGKMGTAKKSWSSLPWRAPGIL